MKALEKSQSDKILIRRIGRDAVDLFIEKKTNEWHRYLSEITN